MRILLKHMMIFLMSFFLYSCTSTNLESQQSENIADLPDTELKPDCTCRWLCNSYEGVATKSCHATIAGCGFLLLQPCTFVSEANLVTDPIEVELDKPDIPIEITEQ